MRAMVRDVPKARALFSQLSGPGTLDLVPPRVPLPSTREKRDEHRHVGVVAKAVR